MAQSWPISSRNSQGLRDKASRTCRSAPSVSLGVPPEAHIAVSRLQAGSPSLALSPGFLSEFAFGSPHRVLTLLRMVRGHFVLDGLPSAFLPVRPQQVAVVCPRFLSPRRDPAGDGPSSLTRWTGSGATRSNGACREKRCLRGLWPTELDVHVVLDNLSAHKAPKVQRWLLRHRRFHFHFTPPYGSWMNLVERWSSARALRPLQRQRARRRHRSLGCDLGREPHPVRMAQDRRTDPRTPRRLLHSRHR